MACQAYDVDLIPTHHPRDVPSIWHDGDSRVLFTDSPYPVTAEVESGSAELEELVLNVRANLAGAVERAPGAEARRGERCAVDGRCTRTTAT